MKSKTLMFSTIMGFLLVLLTFSGSYTQAIGASSQFSAIDTDSTSVFIEEMKIIAGIDSAALVKITGIGGPSTLKITPTTLMDDVRNWIFAVTDQTDYKDYLLRRPFKAPENATLVLEINKLLGADGSLTKALEIAETFGTFYGINLYWSGAITTDLGHYVYKFSGGIENSIFNTVVTEMQGDIATGFFDVFTPTDVADAPVKAAYIGEALSGGAIRGAYYVDPDAITGTTEYTLSTSNIFGGDVTVFDDPVYQKFSIVKFRFPYTINPTSISPATDNFAPQITGKMDWIMQLPWHTKMASSDFEVSFNIDYDELASAPRVGVNMDYDQDLLNQNGILQMDYNVTNTGTETAEDITISYPLGPDFMDFYSNLPTLWRLRDEVTVDETFESEVSVTIDVDGGALGSDSYTQRLIVFTNWYRNTSDSNKLIDIDPTNTSAEVKSEVVNIDIGGTIYPIETTVTISSSAGLSQLLVNYAYLYLQNVTVSGSDLGTLVENNYKEILKAAGEAAKDLFYMIYQEQEIFTFNSGDFTVVPRQVQVGTSNVTKYFLEANISNLAPNTWTEISWALEDIPNENWFLSSMRPEIITNPDDTKAVNVTTQLHDFYELMRTILGFSDWAGQLAYGRPISFFDYANEVWVSAGARFKYEDPEGFEYFGFSNGINFQVADDEAVLNTYVELDSLAYEVGDEVTISGYVKNTGNLPAEDVKLMLFHGRMDRNWQIADPELFYTETVGTINNGTTYNFEVKVEGNSFLGIHPVYAVVDFISDKDQEEALVTNPFNGNTGYFEGAAEAHEIVISNMAWGLLLPKTEALEPAFPQPVLDIVTDVEIVIPDDAPWELHLELIITNIGESETHVTVNQFYNVSQLELQAKSTTSGSISNSTYLGMGLVSVQGVTLAPNETFTITMEWMFLTSQGCYLPGAQIIYDSRYENELDENGETDVGESMMMAMNGETQDADSWEDYGESTSTGSSAGADIYTGGGDKTRRIGSNNLIFLTLGTIFITAMATIIRKKKQ